MRTDIKAFLKQLHHELPKMGLAPQVHSYVLLYLAWQCALKISGPNFSLKKLGALVSTLKKPATSRYLTSQANQRGSALAILLKGLDQCSPCIDRPESYGELWDLFYRVPGTHMQPDDQAVLEYLALQIDEHDATFFKEALTSLSPEFISTLPRPPASAQFSLATEDYTRQIWCSLAARFLKLQQGMQIYNPCCGTGNFALAAAAVCPQAHTVSVDCDELMTNICAMRAQAAGIETQTYCADMFSTPSKGQIVRYERVFCMPPTQLPLHTYDNYLRSIGLQPSTRHVIAEDAYLLQILASLKSSGRAVVILDLSSCGDEIFCALIAQGLLEAVIPLPCFTGDARPVCDMLVISRGNRSVRTYSLEQALRLPLYTVPNPQDYETLAALSDRQLRYGSSRMTNKQLLRSDNLDQELCQTTHSSPAD